MATTTTINPSGDAYLRQDQADTAYGTNWSLRVGQFSGTNRRHAVFEFDVSAFTAPSDIVEANFTLTQNTSYDTNVRTMKLTRLNQTFTSAETTWNSASTGTVWTGGAGAQGNGEYTEPVYSVLVGNNSGNQTVDIKELVIDAINKRAGVLRMVLAFDPADTDTSSLGSVAFYSSNSGTTPPTLAIKVAERKVWTNKEEDDNLSTGSNWLPSGIPTSDDYALFNSGNDTITLGSLSCNKLYIGKNFTGRMGSPLPLVSPPTITTELHCSSNSAELYLEINDSVSTICKLYVADTSPTAGQFQAGGKYEATIRRTRHRIDLRTGNTTRIDAHSSSASFSCDDDVDTVRLSGANAVLDDGGTAITVTNGGRVELSNTNLDDAVIKIASNASARIYADELEEITIYSGIAKFKGNTGAPIKVRVVYIYGGMVDARTGSGTFATTSATRVYGGRFLLDPATNAAIA
jgi:hypothetical protein